MNATCRLRLVSALSLLALLSASTVRAAGAKPARAARPSAAHHVVPFIADDLERALADAKKTNRPVFVESWAPW